VIRGVILSGTLIASMSGIAAPPVVELGPRPFYLVEKMAAGHLKETLQQCAKAPVFHQTGFSIGHRGGATLQFPEHTRESYEAGARMGAGILECDVTFTNDRQLVCRHDQCDLHTTTNILSTDLAAKCSQPFSPAEFDATGQRTKAASALCCTSDLTLAEFKSLKGKMDAANPDATTAEEFQRGTSNWRTDLYATGGTLLDHKESIELIRSLGARFTPELKGPNRKASSQVEEVFGSQEAFAQALIDDYKGARIPPTDVFAQSFSIDDVVYWIEHEPSFGTQVVYLVGEVPGSGPLTGQPDVVNQNPASLEEFVAIKNLGVNIVAPPMPTLLAVADGSIVASNWAKYARRADLDIITWTLERSGRIVEDVLPTKRSASPSFYYQSTLDALHNDGDILVTLDALARQVGVLGVFSDWAATVSYYANCMRLK